MRKSTRVDNFIERWAASGAAERSNYQIFLSELCDIIGAERPHPAQSIQANNAHIFDKTIPLPHGSTAFIDLHKHHYFVLEAGTRQCGRGAAFGQ